MEKQPFLAKRFESEVQSTLSRLDNRNPSLVYLVT